MLEATVVYLGYWFNKLISFCKNFKFTRLELSEGNEMIRTSWYGRHDYVPYVRLDLWRVGYRISYDPNYYKLYNYIYYHQMSRESQLWCQKYIADRLAHMDDEKCVEVTRGAQLVREPVTLWRDLCRAIKNKGFV